ncbi:hypothetical protein HPB48_024361 [Haemaphysalis longicornis]|uniref:DDE Tnp4 domain-containing protein n=1 Tax=Haemaphysalis longicornis TaxID=44386 RepID=A0A9J6H7J1_HAELO|nr:hypothetical protein HPB48_024361 [Haemaphysalis longicornis]
MERFNNTHRRQRVVVEGAFGILKDRFQRLQYIDVASVEHVVEIVIAACVLHNIARRCCDTIDSLQETASGTDVSPTYPGDVGETSVVASPCATA